MSAPLDAAQLAAVAAIWQRRGHELEATFGGDSMRPSIAPGDAVRLRFTAAWDVGDVVLCTARDRVTLHRAVARGDAWVLTQGDNNTFPDPPFDAAAVVARVTAGDGGPPAAFRRARLRRVVQRLCIALMRTHAGIGAWLIRLLLVARRERAAMLRAA